MDQGAGDDGWIVRDQFFINNPAWFDHQGLLTKDVLAEGAPERLGLVPASSRPIDRISMKT